MPTAFSTSRPRTAERVRNRRSRSRVRRVSTTTRSIGWSTKAQTHASDDEEKRKQIETRNKLDGLVYSTEKLISENREKLPESETKAIDEVLAEAKKALEEGAEDQMAEIHERLTQASHQIAATLYQTATADGGSPGPDAHGQDPSAPSDGDGGADDEVIDAEYVDVEAEEEK